MAILERIWELLGVIFGGLLGMVERGATAVFGSQNARQLKKLTARVEQINALEPKYQSMSDEELREQTQLFRNRLRAGETLDDILEEAFAVCREGGKRWLNMRHYDVQMIGGMVLHSGAIAEMVTGEGKTLVATLPCYLNALEGKGVHVITVNDYLARRDMEWMAPLYMGLGLTIGTIQGGMSTSARQAAYACDITYGTNNEFGFDYLRDNMRPAARGDDRFPKEMQQSQGPLNYAIIDEVDNILIDEARTPLIISGPAHTDPQKYAEANRIAKQLQKELHFTVNEKDHSVTLSDEGVREAEKLAGVESFYTAGNMEWPHLIDNSLKALHLYKRDVNYVVKDGQIVIVDEFTGRLMEGRQWSDGLHQSVEAKEGVRIKEETQTMATITLQNFFKLYNKLSGMTGTAMTEANEFWKIYHLDVVEIPTNRVLKRIENPDVIYMSEREKYEAVAQEIERAAKWDILEMKDGSEVWGTIQSENDSEISIIVKGEKNKQSVPREKIESIERSGRPVLVGTVSIEKSERLGSLLERRGIKHEVLNAKQHKREAEIVAQAGRLGAVTIATNMAGRGTDIILGGNPETMAWAQLQDKYPTRLEVPKEEWDALVGEIQEREKMKEAAEEVRTRGGLMVIGTERHESRRIDLQLRGRCGRQGDFGSSRFFLSLEDDLMRIFAGDWVKSVMVKLGMTEGEAIESAMVSRRIASAQKKVEERNFEIRKSLLEYDEVMDEQRKRVYTYRQQILDGVSCSELILSQIKGQVDHYVDILASEHYGAESFAAWSGSQLGCQLEPKDFRNMDYQAAEQYAKDQAERAAEAMVLEAVEENLPYEEDEADWNWNALVNWCNTKYGTNYRDKDLKQLERRELEEQLTDAGCKAIAKVDLSPGEMFLAADFGLQTIANWVRDKFGIEVTVDEMRDLESKDIKALLVQRAQQAYSVKEAEYPILAGLSRFCDNSGGQNRIDREGLALWAQDRFGVEVAVEDLRSLQRDELKQLLVDISSRSNDQAGSLHSDARKRVEDLFAGADAGTTATIAAGSDESLDALTQWMHEELRVRLPKDEIARMDRATMLRTVDGAVDERYHPEMRRMERQVLLNIVDTAWKDHLLAMDHLRSSVSLKSYAQMDPKVEYKREGMRLFETMWTSIGERTTDLIFRMESLNEDFVRSTFMGAQERHDDTPSGIDAGADQANEAASASQDGDAKIEPVRNRGEKIRPNDKCPCGSGKKYKACCKRHGTYA
ncbi:preprotein translocase subunit SecA [Rosistilla oblonga]|uniref:Protein translocase subunit SecA n=2 Tax=Rosistilla oblonga TaxID=2527990 RepID=A0A518IX90_9BACT|nr:preprotein translocase subunit SecA [Rosistilla oblonga]QDV14105.1 preprotein translocase subunit SecA [Rosistilla oblonga]QDV57701.1 preprotein translocase subunit SecA [Rosistilla oblonga]